MTMEGRGAQSKKKSETGIVAQWRGQDQRRQFAAQAGSETPSTRWRTLSPLSFGDCQTSSHSLTCLSIPARPLLCQTSETAFDTIVITDASEQPERPACKATRRPVSKFPRRMRSSSSVRIRCSRLSQTDAPSSRKWRPSWWPSAPCRIGFERQHEPAEQTRA